MIRERLRKTRRSLRESESAPLPPRRNRYPFLLLRKHLYIRFTRKICTTRAVASSRITYPRKTKKKPRARNDDISIPRRVLSLPLDKLSARTARTGPILHNCQLHTRARDRILLCISAREHVLARLIPRLNHNPQREIIYYIPFEN